MRGWSLALVLTCACAVDNAGIARQTGSAGGGAGAGGAGGGGASAGVGGENAAAGTGGGGAVGGAGAAAGDGAQGGAGAAGGTGLPGSGGNGSAGNGSAGTDAAAGTAGAGAAGSSGGVIATAGQSGSSGGPGAGGGGAGESGAGGQGGEAGDGAGGRGGVQSGGGAGGVGLGGRGGLGGTIGGCSACPACTHCANGACSPDPGSLWKVVCVGATIVATRPNGDPWDPPLRLGDTTAPDPQCAFWVGNFLVSETSVLSNTFTPTWDESITPSSRFSASLLSSQSNPWSIRVTDDDPLPGADPICSVSPVLDDAAFASRSATFTAGSCTTLEIGLDCVSP
jgi:hypothetical protein